MILIHAVIIFVAAVTITVFPKEISLLVHAGRDIGWEMIKSHAMI
jgi:hypothetical protein